MRTWAGKVKIQHFRSKMIPGLHSAPHRRDERKETKFPIVLMLPISDWLAGHFMEHMCCIMKVSRAFGDEPHKRTGPSLEDGMSSDVGK